MSHLCGKRISEQEKLNIHLKVHREDKKLLQCDICNLKVTSESKLIVHRHELTLANGPNVIFAPRLLQARNH